MKPKVTITFSDFYPPNIFQDFQNTPIKSKFFCTTVKNLWSFWMDHHLHRWHHPPIIPNAFASSRLLVDLAKSPNGGTSVDQKIRADYHVTKRRLIGFLCSKNPEMWSFKCSLVTWCSAVCFKFVQKNGERHSIRMVTVDNKLDSYLKMNKLLFTAQKAQEEKCKVQSFPVLFGLQTSIP